FGEPMPSVGSYLGGAAGDTNRGAMGFDYAPPDPEFPLPLYHERPETGGFYAAGEFLLLRQTNPLNEQQLKELLVKVEETHSGSLLLGVRVNSDAGLTGSIVVLAEKDKKLASTWATLSPTDRQKALADIVRDLPASY